MICQDQNEDPPLGNQSERRHYLNPFRTGTCTSFPLLAPTPQPPVHVVHINSIANLDDLNTAHNAKLGVSLGSSFGQSIGSPNGTKLGDKLGSKEGMPLGAKRVTILVL